MIGIVLAFIVVAVMTKGFKRNDNALVVSMVALAVLAIVNLVITGSVFG